jgi:hypothetical protein
MPKFDSPFAAQKYRKKQRLQREAEAAIYPDDKLRVRPTHYQAVATRSGKQILKFRPTEVIDDPHRIRLMDELGVSYVVLSVPPEDLDQEPDPTDPNNALLATIPPTMASTLATLTNAMIAASIPNALALATVPLVLATVPPAPLDALMLATLPGVVADAGTTILATISPAPLATIPDVEHDERTATGEGMPPKPEPESGDWEPGG